MKPQHTHHRWFAICLSIFLGMMSLNAAAIDAGTVKGTFTIEGKVFKLQNVYAWQPLAQAEELWVYVTDAKLSPEAIKQGGSTIAKLVAKGGFNVVKLIVHPTKPDLNALKVRLDWPNDSSNVTTSGPPQWQALQVSGRRVTGKLQYKHTGIDNWALDAEFSAPIFGSSGNAQTLTAAQAQKSPQADTFLAYEKALYTQGLEAAGAYMTPERLAASRESVKQFGEAKLKEMIAQMAKSTPQGEARRKQIEKMVLDGDYAVLTVRENAQFTSEPTLLRTKGGWKLSE